MKFKKARYRIHSPLSRSGFWVDGYAVDQDYLPIKLAVHYDKLNCWWACHHWNTGKFLEESDVRHEAVIRAIRVLWVMLDGRSAKDLKQSIQDFC